MTPPSDAPPADQSPRRSRRSLIGFIIAVALLAAATWALIRNPDELRHALDAARNAPWWLIALALVFPLANCLLMSLCFWVLMNRHGRVRFAEMTCLIGAAWLLNYLPLRPGLIGRVAYHKSVNGIPVSRSVQVTIIAIALAGLAILIFLGVTIVAATLQPVVAGSIAIFAAPAVIPLAAAPLLGQRWREAVTLSVRYADLLVWAARYVVAFRITGHEIPFTAGAAISCVVQIAMLVPLFGNGMGLREWAVGASAAALPPDVMNTRGALSTASGIAGDLCNRVAEVLVAIPVGLISFVFLARHRASR